MIIVLPKWTEKPVVRLLAGFGLIIILLVGAALIWVSSDRRYDGRVFEIDPVSVNFGTPGAKVTVGFVKSVTAEQDGGRTLYTIEYVANDLPGQISFYYDTEKGESLYFKSRQTVFWTRRPKI